MLFRSSPEITRDAFCAYYKAKCHREAQISDSVVLHTHFKPDLAQLAPTLSQNEVYIDAHYEVIAYKTGLMSNGCWLRCRYTVATKEYEWSLRMIPKEYEDVLDTYVPYYEIRDPSQISSALAKILDCEEEEDFEDYNLVPIFSIPFVRYHNEARTCFVDIASLRKTYYMVGTLSSLHTDPKPDVEILEGVVASKCMAHFALYDDVRYLHVTNNKYTHLWKPFIVEKSTLLSSYVTPLDEWL